MSNKLVEENSLMRVTGALRGGYQGEETKPASGYFCLARRLFRRPFGVCRKGGDLRGIDYA
jgi:hypothetical protein